MGPQSHSFGRGHHWKPWRQLSAINWRLATLMSEVSLGMVNAGPVVYYVHTLGDSGSHQHVKINRLQTAILMGNPTCHILFGGLEVLVSLAKDTQLKLISQIYFPKTMVVISQIYFPKCIPQIYFPKSFWQGGGQSMI